MSFLESNILKLRAAEPEDLELLYQWENDTHLWAAGNTRVPYSKFQLKQYIAQSSYDIFEHGHLRLMMMEKASGKVVGTVDLFDLDIHHSRIALGLFVAEEFQGKGFARESLKLVENYVFNFLKINQLYVQIAESNTASCKLFEGNFELHGCRKNWIRTPTGLENIVTYPTLKS